MGWVAAVAAALGLLGTVADARAGDLHVDLELVLAVDVSRSMDYDEQRLQRDGYISAFNHPEVVQAIKSGGLGRIAVAYLEWAGQGLHRLVVPWTLIDSAETAAAFAARIDDYPIQPLSRTSVSYGLKMAAGLFDGNGLQGVRRVIDISGDGPNNSGEPVEGVRDRLVADGITINGLPILLKATTPSGWYDIRNLDKYYEDCVIGGFGAFLIPVTEEHEFATAIRRKLVLEIAALRPRLMRAQAFMPIPEQREKTDCLVGEKMWMYRWGN